MSVVVESRGSRRRREGPVFSPARAIPRAHLRCALYRRDCWQWLMKCLMSEPSTRDSTDASPSLALARASLRMAEGKLQDLDARFIGCSGSERFSKYFPHTSSSIWIKRKSVQINRSHVAKEKKGKCVLQAVYCRWIIVSREISLCLVSRRGALWQTERCNSMREGWISASHYKDLKI